MLDTAQVTIMGAAAAITVTVAPASASVQSAKRPERYGDGGERFAEQGSDVDVDGRGLLGRNLRNTVGRVERVGTRRLHIRLRRVCRRQR